MNKKEIMEIKRRLKKEGCTFTRMCGCYVDAEKNKVVDFGQTFLNLEDEEFYKYLEIAKKVLSGNIGNNLLTLDIPLEEEAAGGRQQFLMGLRESKLKNEELIDRFYDLVIDSYDYAGNYLILVFHDAYDVMTRTGWSVFPIPDLYSPRLTTARPISIRCCSTRAIPRSRIPNLWKTVWAAAASAPPPSRKTCSPIS